jgi:hypothetical protein
MIRYLLGVKGRNEYKMNLHVKLVLHTPHQQTANKLPNGEKMSWTTGRSGSGTTRTAEKAMFELPLTLKRSELHIEEKLSSVFS